MAHAKRGRRELGIHGRVVPRAVRKFLRHDLSSHLGTYYIIEWENEIGRSKMNLQTVGIQVGIDWRRTRDDQPIMTGKYSL